MDSNYDNDCDNDESFGRAASIFLKTHNLAVSNPRPLYYSSEENGAFNVNGFDFHIYNDKNECYMEINFEDQDMVICEVHENVEIDKEYVSSILDQVPTKALEFIKRYGM